MFGVGGRLNGHEKKNGAWMQLDAIDNGNIAPMQSLGKHQNTLGSGLDTGWPLRGGCWC